MLNTEVQLDVIRCPRCRSRVSGTSTDTTDLKCLNCDCLFAKEGFPTVNGKPVLIDFQNSVFDKESFFAGSGKSPVQRRPRSLRVYLSSFLLGRNRIVERCCDRLRQLTKKNNGDKPTIIVIGGGSIGSGADGLYSDPEVHVVGTDVYDFGICQLSSRWSCASI